MATAKTYSSTCITDIMSYISSMQHRISYRKTLRQQFVNHITGQVFRMFGGLRRAALRHGGCDIHTAALRFRYAGYRDRVLASLLMYVCQPQPSAIIYLNDATNLTTKW